MKKTLLFLAIIPCIAFAIESSSKDYYNSIDSKLDKENPNPIYYPATDKMLGLVGVEFLYWKAIQGSSDWAIQGQIGTQNGSNEAVGQIGKFHIAKFDWDPGFRVYTGLQFNPHFWELIGEYTYYHSSRNSILYPVNQELALNEPNMLPYALIGTYPQFTDSATSVAKIKTHLNYNGANLYIGKRLFFSSIFLKFYMGLTGGWLNEEWRFVYIGTSMNPNKQKWKFHGGGMRIGLNTDWALGYGFTLLGKFSIAELLGYYRQKSFSFSTNTGPDGNGIGNIVQNVTYSDNRIATNLQFFMGISYSRKLCKSLITSIYIGYEINSWLNLHETIQSVSSSTRSFDGRSTLLKRGTLSLHGLTTGMSFYF
ncbi:MAG: hypothetical protein KDC82_08985 [Bacteroidetes bacterium]|nr:hypothetical protein [Bacteroidota bacterium]MCP5490343.1 hypothetical protein [Chlamydiales bacterium]